MPDEFKTQPPPYEWQVPPAAMPESYRLGWLDESVQQGQAWFKSQRPSADIHRALDTIANRDTGYTITAAYRSHISPNRLKRNVREVVGALAELRPMWGYHSDNKAYAARAEMMNKVTRAWYLEAFADRSIKEALQYAAATGRGWVHPVYRRDMFGTGRGDIKLFTYGSPCILPVQLPSNGDWQSAYTVTILDEMPVAMAHGMFPLYQSRLTPRSSRYWYADDNIRKSALGNFGNILQRIFGKGRRSAGDPALADLLVPLRKTYVIDLSVNRTGKTIPMGEPGASWYYEVPSIGQEIPNGPDGRTKKADEVDARLYPYRRLLISSSNCIMYDGPAFDWHGMFPAVSFAVDEWPWEPLGFSLIHDGFEINESIKEVSRGVMDKVRAQLKPSMAYDTNAVAKKEADNYDPYLPDSRVGFDGQAIDEPPFRPVLPVELTKVDAVWLEFIRYLEESLDAQLGVRDVAALAKMRAVGSMDELEKIMESMGPIIKDISRGMEPPMRDLGVMVKYNICQNYTTARIMQWVGADGVSKEIFDYDPDSLIPSHLPGEDTAADSPTSRIKRARVFADNLRFFILPNSLHEMTQMVMKLGLIQLRKAGVKISSQTIAEAWQVANYGTFDGNTELERWQSEQEMDLEFAAKMQAIGESLGLTPPGAANPAGGKKNPEGRPPSGGAPPALKSKEGGARSTITESK